MRNLKMYLSLVLIGFGFIACEKDDSNSDLDYLSKITGTYNGEFFIDAGLKSSNFGTADVSLTENEQLQIHCYGNDIDTTFIMDAYENGDSIMICDTGEAFEHEYGRMGHGKSHMMDMHKNQTEWEHHMSEDHEEFDEHFGGFNMTNNSFEYRFRMTERDSNYEILFKGIKN